jgi:hypothetical protein
MKTALIVVFNNPFPKNIPLLDRLYRSKFDKIFYLIDAPSIYPGMVPVKGISYNFQNFYLQAFDQIRGSDYYFITHDDALLNPRFRPATAFSHFNLPEDAICIRNIEMIPNDAAWHFTWKGVYDVVQKNENLQSVLQSFKPHLIQRYQNQILPVGCSRYDMAKWEKTVNSQSEILFGNGAFSDILMMPGIALQDLVASLQMLQAPDLFVEAAIPTAILLTQWKIHLMASSSHAPTYFWGKETQKHAFSYLFRMLKEDRIAVHPIKLGKMKKFQRWAFINMYLMLGRMPS